MDGLKAEKGARGWSLRTPDRDTVVDREGFVVWFTSKAKATAAAPAVKHDKREDWLIYDGPA